MLGMGGTTNPLPYAFFVACLGRTIPLLLLFLLLLLLLLVLGLFVDCAGGVSLDC